MKKKHSYFIDYVKMSIKLTKRSMILTEIIMKCFQRATNAAEDASDEDPDSDWTREHYFVEDGLIMTSALATPMVYKYAAAYQVMQCLCHIIQIELVK